MKNPWRSVGASAVLLVLLTVLAYLPALSGGFVWDDDRYVTTNPALRSLAGLGRIWTQPGMGLRQYYPLTFTGFWVQYHLWHLQPFGYHLVNVLLHAVNAVLLLNVLRRLEVPGSWWTAALWAVHPVNVESVAWVTEFKNVLSGLFSLLALLAFLRFRPLSAAGTSATRDWRFYAPALLLFLCALLSKTAVCCLPVVVAVLLWWKLDRVTKRDILALVPWFVMSLTLGLITVRVESGLPETSPTSGVWSVVQRGLLAGRALWFYVGKVLWPHPLTFVYPRWNINTGAAWQYLFPIAAVAALIVLWLLRRRIGKGPLAGVLCFVTMALPVLGFFHIYFFRFSYVTDHFQYLACIGLIALVTGVGAALVQRANDLGRRSAEPIAVVVLLALGVSTWRQAQVYKDLQTLWVDTLAKNPNAWLAHNELGMIRMRAGKVNEAVEHWETALRINPDNPEAHNNLGLTLDLADKRSEAIGHFRQALQIRPNFPDAHNNLGNSLLQEGKVSEAIAEYRETVRFTPRSSKAHNNLGYALLRAGQVPEAIEQLEQALRLSPDFAEAHCTLGAAYEQVGRVTEAIAHYEQALRIKPDYTEARNRLTRLQAVQ